MDLDVLDDIFSFGTTKNVRAVGKFQPKGKLRKPGKESLSTTVTAQHAVQIKNAVESKLDKSITTTEPSDHNDKWNSGSASIFLDKGATNDAKKISDSSVSVLHDMPNDGGGPNPCMENSSANMGNIELESLNDFLPSVAADTDTSRRFTDRETNVSNHGRFGQLGVAEQEIEETNIMETDYASQLITVPEMQLQEISPAGTDPGFCAVEANILHKDSVPSSGQEDIPDISYAEEFACTVHTDTASKLPVIDESPSFTEMNGMISNIPLERVTEPPVKFVSRRAKIGINHMHSTSDTIQPHTNVLNEQGWSLRPRKNKECQSEPVNEPDDDVLSGQELSANAVLENDDINDQDYQVEYNPPAKNAKKRKSKKSDVEKEKVDEKRNRVDIEKDPAPKPKKFSHSTRRRKVDKVLLETPEDEIDYRNVPIRDLLLLAEHNERLLKKEESVSVASASKQSNRNSSEFVNQDGNDEHSCSFVDESNIYYNYQTYMDRTPTTRWSKQDTELFYEAVQQFGTDLSLIQQLFPGRTRRQVKLKYKKEERQHPMRLSDALTSRSKDHSHFEKVIEQLNQIAAEERENADKDCLTESRGDDDMENDIPDIHDEEANNEENGEKETEEHAEPESGKGTSPLKSYDSEDELFEWSQYRTD